MAEGFNKWCSLTKKCVLVAVFAAAAWVVGVVEVAGLYGVA